MDAEAGSSADDDRPECRYGMNCYRRNPGHFAQYRHPENHAIAKQFPKRPHSPTTSTSSKTTTTAAKDEEKSDTEDGSDSPVPSKKRHLDPEPEQDVAEASTSVGEVKFDPERFGFYLAAVRGIKSEWNGPTFAKDLKELLATEADNLVSSIQFNYMFDIPWLIDKYPSKARKRPILIVTAARNQAESQVIRSDILNSNEKNGTTITVALARLPIAYGTHHTKMMILKYTTGIRIIVHTANMIPEDWDQKTQGMYITPLLPKMGDAGPSQPPAEDNFKDDLIAYLSAYSIPALDSVVTELKNYDMSPVKVKLVGSVPGRHQGGNIAKWGHGRLRALLRKYVTSNVVQRDWPAIVQFSSIGSLGPTPESWLLQEFRESLTATRDQATGAKSPLKLIFPTVENVRTSLEGYSAGGSLPYSIENATKQKYLKQFLHQWRSECRGRSRASPHIKTYFRVSPDWKKLGWFLLTSANLSKAAWGAYEKNYSQLMVRSYELGVLFFPQTYGQDYFDVIQSPQNPYSTEGVMAFPVPYDLPLTPYDPDDEPWVSNIRYREKRDTHGRFWR